MSIQSPLFGSVSRRAFVALSAALAPATLFGLRAADAQETGTAPTEVDAAPQQFSFDLLTEEMRLLASKPHVTAPPPEGFLGELTYDDYRLIRFADSRQRWNDEGSNFRLGAFHMGWLFPEPVKIYEVANGESTEMRFSTDDFEYLNDLAKRVPEHAKLPGVAGFRLNYALNRPDKLDELAAFVGASYFRALGRGNAYGLSARGLAVNSGMSTAEEFPRFSRFYIERPGGLAGTITVYAALESERLVPKRLDKSA